MVTKHVVLVPGAWSRGTELCSARAAFEVRGYTVHSPTLRHHDLAIADGADKIATLSVRDYLDDLVPLVNSLDAPPLLVGHSLGGLLVQLLAPRCPNVGVVAACPSPVGPVGLNAAAVRLSRNRARFRPWAKPVHPPDWEAFRDLVCGAQSEDVARAVYDDLVCESGRVMFFELAAPWLDRANAAVTDVAAVTGPVLAIAGERDRVVRSSTVRHTVGRYAQGSFAEIGGSDHLVFSGRALAHTMEAIDKWVDANQVFAIDG